ncbi:MAG: type I restriction enzyme HsdR N-terminal domain-containing protein [Candidatus Moraniibacteriota bacterium]
METGIIKKYLESQKTKVVEVFDFENKKVKYSEKIKGWKIDKFRGDEEIVRAYILAKLVNELGYKPENIELEKEYEIGRPKVNKPRIDIIVRDDAGNAFLYIELKSPQDYEKDKDEIIEKQLFNLASQEQGQGKKVKYLTLYTFEIVENKIKDKCILIDYEKFSSFNLWKEVRDFADELPERYGNNMVKNLKTEIINKEANKLKKQFYYRYGYTDKRENFFTNKLSEFAEKVSKKDSDLNKELWNFIDEYKANGLGGFNSTYGRLYHLLIDFTAGILELDAFELRSSVVYK